ncbi:hypothetical protein SCANM63S_01808 [Streptomyces canarius]
MSDETLQAPESEVEVRSPRYFTKPAPDGA